MIQLLSRLCFINYMLKHFHSCWKGSSLYSRFPSKRITHCFELSWLWCCLTMKWGLFTASASCFSSFSLTLTITCTQSQYIISLHHIQSPDSEVPEYPSIWRLFTKWIENSVLPYIPIVKISIFQKKSCRRSKSYCEFQLEMLVVKILFKRTQEYNIFWKIFQINWQLYMKWSDIFKFLT